MRHQAAKSCSKHSWRRWLRRNRKKSCSNQQAAIWQGFEPLEPRILLAAPDFASPLFNQVVSTDGSAMTIGIDATDADGNAVTITAVSDDANLTTFVPQGNRFAHFNYEKLDGTVLGTVTAEIFETRGGDAAARIVTLAASFYTDVLVHRIADLTGAANQAGVIIQTGDAQFGNGTGGSPLGEFNDQFNLQDNLSFFGRGVIAMANSGPNTNDSQIFFTNGSVTHLNGIHMILGQVVTGFGVLDQVISLGNGGSRMASVDIVSNTQDGTISFTASPGWDGIAEVTVSLDDGTGNVTQQQITVVSPAVLGNLPVIDLSGDQFLPAGAIVQFDVTDDGGLPMDLSIFTSTSTQMPTEVNGDTGVILLQPPADSNLIYDLQIQAFEEGFDPSNINIRRVKAISQTADAPPILGRASSVNTENTFGTFLDGDILFVANGTLGLDVYDISDPAAPTLLGIFNTAGTARDVAVIDDVAFIADGSNGLISLDVSNPASIQPLDITSNGRAAINVFIEGDLAYVASDDDGLIIYDISNNTNITQLGLFDEFIQGLDINDAFDIAKIDNIAFLTDPTLGVFAIDVTDPANMVFIGLFATKDANDDPLNPEGIDIAGGVLYVTTVNGLSLFDVSDPNTLTGIVDIALTNLPSHVVVGDGLAVVSATGGYFFLDVTDPTTPLVVYTFGAARFNGNQTGVDVAVTASISGTRIALPLFNSGTLIMDGQSFVHRPEVTDVQVNHGLAQFGGPTEFDTQRSQLLNVTFTFSSEIAVDVDDVQLIALGMNPGVDTPVPIALALDDLAVTANGDGTYNLTVELHNNLPADGVFELRLTPSLTSPTGFALNDSLDYVFRTHQLLGDFDGDGRFNGSPAEVATFEHWFTQLGGVPDFLDLNGSGGFNILDMGPFVGNFGTELTYNNPNGFVAQGASASQAPASAANTASSGSLTQLLNSATTTHEVQAPSALSAASLWQPRSTATSITASSSLKLVAMEDDDDSQDPFIATQAIENDPEDSFT